MAHVVPPAAPRAAAAPAVGGARVIVARTAARQCGAVPLMTSCLSRGPGPPVAFRRACAAARRAALFIAAPSYCGRRRRAGRALSLARPRALPARARDLPSSAAPASSRPPATDSPVRSSPPLPHPVSPRAAAGRPARAHARPFPRRARGGRTRRRGTAAPAPARRRPGHRDVAPPHRRVRPGAPPHPHGGSHVNRQAVPRTPRGALTAVNALPCAANAPDTPRACACAPHAPPGPGGSPLAQVAVRSRHVSPALPALHVRCEPLDAPAERTRGSGGVQSRRRRRRSPPGGDPRPRIAHSRPPAE